MISFDAWADESFACPEGRADGVYVVAAATFEREVSDVRATMLEIRGRRPGKLHWSEMSADQRRKAVERVSGLGG